MFEKQRIEAEQRAREQESMMEMAFKRWEAMLMERTKTQIAGRIGGASTI